MKKKILILDNITIDKRRFHYPKNPIWIDDIYIYYWYFILTRFLLVKRDINTLLVAKIMKKLSTACNASKNDRIWKKIDEAKFLSILIKDDQLLKKYIQIWVKMGYYMEKEFHSKPVHN